MTSRERIKSIISGKPADRCGFWLGNPDVETWKILQKYLGIEDKEQIRQKLNDDVRWICPQFFPGCYKDPQGRAMFDAGLNKKEHGQTGPLTFAETIDDIEKYPWPNPDYLNFDQCLQALQTCGDYYRLSGLWTCFYHNVMDLFGFETYMLNMIAKPELITVATDKVCQFYYEANERFFAVAGDMVDGFFFGNDFGTQLDLICGP